jgi:asparagine synthase (glutamine-hydrolysing)
MCGVAAIWSYGAGADDVDPSELNAITDAMTRRGPDGRGIWVGDDGRFGMGHRRLAVIGLGDQGKQPMQLGPDCRTGQAANLAVSFNGEIYNFAELRRDLEQEGHRVHTATDTEVLLHLYEQHGRGFVRKLRGMFGFALWDGVRRQLHLARDPLGIKPLYIADDRQTIRVASQAKALLAGGRVARATSDAGLAGFFLFGSVPDPLTAWSAIDAVEAGTVVTFESGGSRSVDRYYSLPEALQAPDRADRTPLSLGVPEAFRDSVDAHMVADVEVGLFLSGGIDSSSLLGLATEAGHEIRAVTVGFDEFAGHATDETPLARHVAQLYHARHLVRPVSRRYLVETIPQILDDMDQPSIDGMNTWLVAGAAAEAGLKVAISGIGGDEFLAGYSTFSRVPASIRVLKHIPARPLLGGTFRRLSAPLLSRRSPKLPGLVEYGGDLASNWFLQRAVFMPWDLPEILGADRAASALSALDLRQLLSRAVNPRPEGDLAAISALEGGLYMRNQLLRDADWAGMAHSLEIRVPLSDARLVRAMAAPLNLQWRPRDGKEALGRSPRPPVPAAIADRPKTGFSVPMAEWIVEDSRYSSWRKQSTLVRDGNPWARRWAYEVAVRFGLL